MTIIVTGIDLAKNVFAVHGVNGGGVAQMRQPKVARAKLGVLSQAREHLEDFSVSANLVIGDLLSEVAHLSERISRYDRHVHAKARQSTAAQRLMQLMGIGEATAAAAAQAAVLPSGCRSRHAVLHSDRL